jgi:hypothetical protein
MMMMMRTANGNCRQTKKGEETLREFIGSFEANSLLEFPLQHAS